MSRTRNPRLVGHGGAPVEPGTNVSTNTAMGATFTPTGTSGAHAANLIAALAAMAIPSGTITSRFAQIPSERALAIAQALENLAGEYRRLAGTSRGDLALLRQLEPCHDSMDAAAETTGQSLMLTKRQAASLLGVHVRTLDRMRAAGEGPKAIRVRGAVRYRGRDVDRWLEGKRQ